MDTSTHGASDLGFDCILVHDVCATKSLTYGGVTVSAEHVQTSYLAVIDGSFATIATTEDVLSST